MKTRRHPSVISLMLASVFFLCAFLSSCGIPTYLVPKVSFTKGSENSQTTTFKLKYSSESSGSACRDKIGLLLLYYLDDSANSQRTKIPSTFKSTYMTSTYDGRVVYIKDIDDPVLSYADNGVDHRVYAFTVDGNAVEAPFYTYLPFGGLDNSKDLDLSFSLEYDDSDLTVSLTDSDSRVMSLGFDSDFSPSTKRYIRVFAAVSVQSEDFSNLYWSDLTYVGAMLVPEN